MAVRSKLGICLGNSDEELEGAVCATERSAENSSRKVRMARIRIVASLKDMWLRRKPWRSAVPRARAACVLRRGKNAKGPRKHYYKASYTGKFVERERGPNRRSISKEFQMDGQVFLGIFADGGDQVAGLHQQFISIVIQRRIVDELARRPFSLVQLVGNAVQTGDAGVDFLGQRLILSQSSQRAFAGIDLSHQLVGLSCGLVGIVVQRGVFEELADGPVCRVDLSHGLLQLGEHVVGAIE